MLLLTQSNESPADHESWQVTPATKSLENSAGGSPRELNNRYLKDPVTWHIDQNIRDIEDGQGLDPSLAPKFVMGSTTHDVESIIHQF